MKIIQSLELQLNKQWSALNSIKNQEQFRIARAQALQTFQQLKKQKLMLGLS